MHVKGFTARHPGVPRHLRGTYAGLIAPAALAHLRRLGVTAVELMPIHHFVADKHLRDRGPRRVRLVLGVHRAQLVNAVEAGERFRDLRADVGDLDERHGHDADVEHVAEQLAGGHVTGQDRAAAEEQDHHADQPHDHGRDRGHRGEVKKQQHQPDLCWRQTMSDVQISESKARDAALEAEERLHESRRSFLKTIGAGAAAAAAGVGGTTFPTAAFAYGGPYANAFVLDRSRTYMNIGTTGSVSRFASVSTANRPATISTTAAAPLPAFHPAPVAEGSAAA